MVFNPRIISGNKIGAVFITSFIILLVILFFINGCIWACLIQCYRNCCGRRDRDEVFDIGSLRSSMRRWEAWTHQLTKLFVQWNFILIFFIFYNLNAQKYYNFCWQMVSTWTCYNWIARFLLFCTRDAEIFFCILSLPHLTYKVCLCWWMPS